MSTFIKNFKWGHYEKDFKDSQKQKKNKIKIKHGKGHTYWIQADSNKSVRAGSLDEMSLDDFMIWHRAT